MNFVAANVSSRVGVVKPFVPRSHERGYGWWDAATNSVYVAAKSEAHRAGPLVLPLTTVGFAGTGSEQARALEFSTRNI